MALAHARRHGCPIEMMEAFAKSAVSMLGPTVLVRGTVLTSLAPGPGDLGRAVCKMLELAWMTAHG